MTRTEFNDLTSELESRILITAYHASCRGRFERAWRELYRRTVDELQALLDERVEDARDQHEYLRLCESRGK